MPLILTLARLSSTISSFVPPPLPLFHTISRCAEQLSFTWDSRPCQSIAVLSSSASEKKFSASELSKSFLGVPGLLQTILISCVCLFSLQLLTFNHNRQCKTHTTLQYQPCCSSPWSPHWRLSHVYQLSTKLIPKWQLLQSNSNWMLRSIL